MSHDGIQVVGFEARWRDDFAKLNIEWLQRWFVVEPHDRDVLGNPEQHILAEGGHILFAVDPGGRVRGTVALKHDGGGVYELTKMGRALAACCWMRWWRCIAAWTVTSCIWNPAVH